MAANGKRIIRSRGFGGLVGSLTKRTPAPVDQPASAMSSQITISAAQRDALYGQLVDHLGSIGDLGLLIERQDFASAGRIGQVIADELRLILDDLGWGDGDGKPVTLTLPPSDLKRLFAQLREQADDQLEAERPEQAELREPWQRAQLVSETCDQVLSAVGDPGPGMRISLVTRQMPR